MGEGAEASLLEHQHTLIPLSISGFDLFLSFFFVTSIGHLLANSCALCLDPLATYAGRSHQERGEKTNKQAMPIKLFGGLPGRKSSIWYTLVSYVCSFYHLSVCLSQL